MWSIDFRRVEAIWAIAAACSARLKATDSESQNGGEGGI